jgi:murein DD-endopeptidase MepM/ murein hydrolase activator NlpD
MSGQFEPEGIYLALPLELFALDTHPLLLQGWGEHPEFHGRSTYNGVRLKGHPGLDIAAPPGTWVLAADAGRVVEISVEPGGFGRYIKLEHAWGESLYAGIAASAVDAGQSVPRGHRLARIDGTPISPARSAIPSESGHGERNRQTFPSHLHFAIRIHPYNRFDGWGGFTDPLPYLYAPTLETVPLDPKIEQQSPAAENLPPMLVERPNARRP